MMEVMEENDIEDGLDSWMRDYLDHFWDEEPQMMKEKERRRREKEKRSQENEREGTSYSLRQLRRPEEHE